MFLIGLTDNERESKRFENRGTGFDYFISKPRLSYDLKDIISECLLYSSVTKLIFYKKDHSELLP